MGIFPLRDTLCCVFPWLLAEAMQKTPKPKLQRRNAGLEVPAKVLLLAKGRTSFAKRQRI